MRDREKPSATIGCGEVLALIPARSGSKGIRDKNIRPFHGLPLIAHSIRHGLESRLVGRTVVSTDSTQYAEIAKHHGAEVPFLRPPELATDDATDLSVFQHALEWLDRHEGYRPNLCVHLRATYPVRQPGDIDAMIQRLAESPELDSVRSIAPAPYTPFKMWYWDESGLLRPVVASSIRDAHNLPRQSLPAVYMQNACIDVVRASVVREGQSMTGSRILGYLIEGHHDIDSEDDFRAAALEGSPPKWHPPSK